MSTGRNLHREGPRVQIKRPPSAPEWAQRWRHLLCKSRKRHSTLSITMSKSESHRGHFTEKIRQLRFRKSKSGRRKGWTKLKSQVWKSWSRFVRERGQTGKRINADLGIRCWCSSAQVQSFLLEELRDCSKITSQFRRRTSELQNIRTKRLFK